MFLGNIFLCRHLSRYSWGILSGGQGLYFCLQRWVLASISISYFRTAGIWGRLFICVDIFISIVIRPLYLNSPEKILYVEKPEAEAEAEAEAEELPDKQQQLSRKEQRHPRNEQPREQRHRWYCRFECCISIIIRTSTRQNSTRLLLLQVVGFIGFLDLNLANHLTSIKKWKKV